MFTEWMAHPSWVWAIIGGLTIVVVLVAVAAWTHLDDVEGYDEDHQWIPEA